MERDFDKLDSDAYDVADEYRNKNELKSEGWDATWSALRAELERRCPGFTEAEYDKALNDGFTSSR